MARKQEDAPHGGELIPELANGNLARMAVTRAAMEELERRGRIAAPETVIVYTPHGLSIERHASVSVSLRALGALEGEDGKQVWSEFATDREMARALSRRQLMDFGRATAEAAAATERRVALVCSADQGHGHAADGPYGFALLSSSYDRAYCQAVRENALSRLLHWREDWIEAALPDSYWQTLMLHGALQHTPMQAELLSYEAPTYFGMACAEFRLEG